MSRQTAQLISHRLGPLVACCLCGLQSLQENVSKKTTGQNQVLLVWPHQEAAWPVQLDGSVPRVFEPRESGEAWASDLGY